MSPSKTTFANSFLVAYGGYDFLIGTHVTVDMFYAYLTVNFFTMVNDDNFIGVFDSYLGNGIFTLNGGEFCSGINGPRSGKVFLNCGPGTNTMVEVTTCYYEISLYSICLPPSTAPTRAPTRSPTTAIVTSAPTKAPTGVPTLFPITGLNILCVEVLDIIF